MNWLYNTFVLIIIAFPLIALLFGLVAGWFSNRVWSGVAVGAALTIVLAFTVANTAILAWLPVYMLAGMTGSLLGAYLARRRAGARK